MVGADRPGEAQTVAKLTQRLRGQVVIPDDTRELLADLPTDPQRVAQVAEGRLHVVERLHLPDLHSAMHPPGEPGTGGPGLPNG